MDSLNMSDQDIFAMFNNDEDNILSGASTHSTEFGAVPTSPPTNADFLLNSVDFPNFDELLASAPLAAPAPATLDHLKDAPVAPMPFFVPSAAEVDAVSGHHNHHNNNDIVIPMMAAFDQVPVMSQVASAPVPATIDYSAQQPQQRRRVVVDRAAQPYNNIAAVPAFGNHAGQASATSLSPPPSNPQTGASPGAFDHADILPAIQHVTMSDASSPPAYVDDSSSTATTPPAAVFNSEDETGADDKAASATKKKMPKSKSKRKRKASLGVTQDELEELRAKGLDPEIIAKIENDEVDAATSRAFKRQRRLIRNRESAQLSRQRKKHYVKNLEERVTQFSTENQVLKTKLADLEATNASLEDELKHLRSMMGTQATASSVWSRLQSGGKDGASTNAKSAGMALFVVVLSLGLLFNGSDSSPLPFKTHTPVEVPEVVPSATSDRAYYGRVLNSIEETANVPTHVFTREVRATPPARTTAEVYPHAERAAAAKAAHARQVAETQEQLRSLVEAAKAEAARNSSSAVTTDATTALTDMDTTATTATATTMATSDASSPDAYVMCPRAHTFIPDSSASSDDEEPIISLMLPSSAFDAQGNFSSRGAAAGPHADDDMLQLTCRVSDVTVVPGGNLTATAGNGGGMGAGSEYGAGSSMVASSLGAALVRSEAQLLAPDKSGSARR